MNHQPHLTREQSRRVDRLAIDEYGFSGLVLMENAGRGVADVLCRLGIAGPVVICCGKGNNAGDGFVIARHLDLRGHAGPRAALGRAGGTDRRCAAPTSAFSRRPTCRSRSSAIATTRHRLAQHLAGAAWIVDALLGTGARGEPAPAGRGDRPAQRGAGAETGRGSAQRAGLRHGRAGRHTIRAAETCTFVAEARLPRARGRAVHGPRHVLDIGARELLEEVLGGVEGFRFGPGCHCWLVQQCPSGRDSGTASCTKPASSSGDTAGQAGRGARRRSEPVARGLRRDSCCSHSRDVYVPRHSRNQAVATFVVQQGG